LNIHNTNKKNELLIKLIILYIKNIKKVEKILLESLKLDKLCYWKSEKKPITDRIRNLKYAFHGSGCWVSTVEYEIDFEFDINCNVGSFTIWNLWNFICDNHEIREEFIIFLNKQNLKETCLALEFKGLIKIIDENNYILLTRE